MNFVNPLFLIGGLAAGIPILLHLIRREHARKIEFSTLMFLQRVSRRSIRYQKLRHLLLLLLRILAFLLIVLAFMRPYREKAQASASIGRISTAHIIVVDNSLSMAYRDHWDKAKEAAVRIIHKSEPGDKFAILQFSDRTVARTAFIAGSSEAESEVRHLELSDQATRYAQALRVAERFALDAGTRKRIIHLISDFQKNGWMAEERDFQLGAGIELDPIDVGSADFSNLAFRDVHLAGNDLAQGSEISINASVENYGKLDRKNILIKLFLDGRSVAEKRVDIGSGASQGIEFSLPGLTSGIHPAVLEVEDPYLARDNRFYMTVEARTKTLVQVVETENTDERHSPGYFLSKALNIDTLSPYRMAVVSPQNPAISGSLLIWNSTTGGTAGVQEKIRAFVKSGGGLAITMPEGLQASEFNRTFGSWLPIRYMEGTNPSSFSRRPSEDYALMTAIRMDHPVFKPFSQPNSGSFSGVRFFRHAKLSVGSAADILARFDNGDPALIAVAIEAGRVLVFPSSADDSSNDLPLKAVYAPFWQQALHFLENFQERRPWMEVGATLSPKTLLSDTALRQGKGLANSEASVAILDPRRQRLPLLPGDAALTLETAGFYEIRAMHWNIPVAVNPAAKESDLEHGNAEEMAAGWMASNPSMLHQDERLGLDDLDRRQRLWVLILIGAAVLLIAELILSNAHPVSRGQERPVGHVPIARRQA